MEDNLSLVTVDDSPSVVLEPDPIDTTIVAPFSALSLSTNLSIPPTSFVNEDLFFEAYSSSHPESFEFPLLSLLYLFAFWIWMMVVLVGQWCCPLLSLGHLSLLTLFWTWAVQIIFFVTAHFSGHMTLLWLLQLRWSTVVSYRLLLVGWSIFV